ncbi:hypothetical protein DIPPA_10510 [Diplonema papillatum]|nr:hypothetical protein DIPPA_10510 [Diplonema papillatum]
MTTDVYRTVLQCRCGATVSEADAGRHVGVCIKAQKCLAKESCTFKFLDEKAYTKHLAEMHPAYLVFVLSHTNKCVVVE